MSLEFTLRKERYAVARLAPDSAVPTWASSGHFFSITRTPEELSVICEEAQVPADCIASRGWRALALTGPFAFDQIGIAAEFTTVLAKSGVSVLVVSTYDTDWVLVPASQVDVAARAVLDAGHRFTA